MSWCCYHDPIICATPANKDSLPHSHTSVSQSATSGDIIIMSQQDIDAAFDQLEEEEIQAEEPEQMVRSNSG